MIHKPITLNKLYLELPHKTCFADFCTIINYGDRIAIIGRNGNGKTSLLQMIGSSLSDLNIGYVPQIIQTLDDLSGGERFNKALTEALRLDPDILILDEPTNHLDLDNRKSLIRMLNNYSGTLIIVSHDVELLRKCMDIFWHIDNGKISKFTGSYDDYMKDIYLKRSSIEKELLRLDRERKDMHQALMQEEQRAAKSKQKGQKSIDNKKWPTITGHTKARRAEETSGSKRQAINNKKDPLIQELQDLRLPEQITPKFLLPFTNSNSGSVLSIIEGSVGYQKQILENININLYSGEKLAITGKNGSGKSTILKAILKDHKVVRSGNWYVTNDIGYLDQHYNNLDLTKTVFENIAKIVPHWNEQEIRKHLNDFLFRKTEEVNALVQNISGGEKLRLSLAVIAAKTPRLLLLDEITNNLDLETRQHVIEVLKEYPGSIVIISHDDDFLNEIEIKDFYEIKHI